MEEVTTTLNNVKTYLSTLTLNNVKTYLSTLTFRSLIIFSIVALLIYGLILFFVWLFEAPPSPPQSPIHISSEGDNNVTDNIVHNLGNYRGVSFYNKPEVFNVRDNVYRFPEAENVCKKYNARLASQAELDDAQKKGANWCNLGWLTSQNAYYPIQSEQITVSQKWPKEFKNGCGQVGLNGGFYPSQLKLSVNCYGTKPIDLVNINPWNTVTKKWSRYS